MFQYTHTQTPNLTCTYTAAVTHKELKHNPGCRLVCVCSETTNRILTKTMILLKSRALYSTHSQPDLLCLDWEVHIPSACQGNWHKGPQEPICYCQTGPPSSIGKAWYSHSFPEWESVECPFLLLCQYRALRLLKTAHTQTHSHYLSPGTIVTARAIWAAVKLTISGERTWKYEWEKKYEREFHIPALGKYHQGRERKQQEKWKKEKDVGAWQSLVCLMKDTNEPNGP